MFPKFLIVLSIMTLICSCGPFRPIKSGFLAAKASGWEEEYGIETKEELDSPSVIPKLIMALEDENERVRMSAVRHLTQFGPEAFEAVPQLKLLALTDRNKNIRGASLWAITKIAGPENDHSIYVYDHILADKSRGNRKSRQGLVNMLGREKELGPKVIELLKENSKTEPYTYPKRTMLEIIMKYEMPEEVSSDS